MSKPWLHIVFISGLAVIFTIAVIIMFYPVPEPPGYEINDARQNLIRARENNADEYAPDLLREASDYYDSAMTQLKYQNELFILKRDYSIAARLADMSADASLKASEASISNSLYLKACYEDKLKEAEKLMLQIKDGFSEYPLPQKIRNDISAAKMLVHEAGIAFNEGSYSVADDKITNSLSLLSASFDYAAKSLRDYFSPHHLWKTWVDSTIKYSLENSEYSIIVDKFAHRFFVYLDGKVFCEFEAELGQKWVGDKHRRGDRATPEGMYKIIKKIEGDSTDYYKALLIDYPNASDSASFRQEMEKGMIPAYSGLGDKIEIHGMGGRGADWTMGCIALKNSDMDSLYKYVSVNTPVTIVGSIYNRKQALKR